MTIVFILVVLAVFAWMLSGSFVHAVKACCAARCVECGDSHPHRILLPHLYTSPQWHQW